MPKEEKIEIEEIVKNVVSQVVRENNNTFRSEMKDLLVENNKVFGNEIRSEMKDLLVENNKVFGNEIRSEMKDLIVENNKVFGNEIRSEMKDLFVDYNKVIREEVKDLFVENNTMMLEAMDMRIETTVQKAFGMQTARQEIFEDKILGAIKDLATSNVQTGQLVERIEFSEVLIKNNILPRLEILESKTI